MSEYQTIQFEGCPHVVIATEDMEAKDAELARLRSQRDKLIVALSAAESREHDAIEALATSEAKRKVLVAGISEAIARRNQWSKEPGVGICADATEYVVSPLRDAMASTATVG